MHDLLVTIFNEMFIWWFEEKISRSYTSEEHCITHNDESLEFQFYVKFVTLGLRICDKIGQ